ncbi:hypothetical protein BCR33DRAFT_465975 [Rhizoclosmatium globosum]|uniref:Uncharacterized protein n=1 Tax=Rhizoclosmatium globosum TaxID=329046 RepID=A0A1Y2BR41_9FUNG|nr:hypothetical protein BCR33DRAFT_465975 [Rhizoclosmatium globosum]|eukprot:ORY37218.1 hypothetical protein BCR33DRAFT_465975 [Rhizoclosmatium globosum]
MFYQSYFKNLYYTSSQNGFIGLFTIANSNQVWVSLPLNSVNPTCAVCEFWKTMSATDLALAAKSSNLSWAPWNIGKQIATGPYRSMSTPFVPVTRPWYVQAAKSVPTNISVQYTSPYLFLKGIPGISANVPVFDKSGSLQGVIATDIPFSDIQSNLVNYLQTPNAFMYVFTADGTLVGNTINETLVLPNGSLKTIYAMEHVVMLQVAKYIQSLVSQNQTLQSLASPATYFENNGYLFQLRMMDSAPYFFIVNGAPKTDYTLRIDEMFNSLQSTLDGTVGTVIELTAGIFVLVVVASCFLIYFGIAKPLKVWTDVMVQAADYDFDAIKNFKRRGNFISELNEIEVAFFEMIAKFATAISSNKAITQRSGAVVSKASSQNTVSASPDKSVA